MHRLSLMTATFDPLINPILLCLTWHYYRIIELLVVENSSMFIESSCQPSTTTLFTIKPCIISTHFLNASRHSDPTTTLSSLFQYFAAISITKPPLVKFETTSWGSVTWETVPHAVDSVRNSCNTLSQRNTSGKYLYGYCYYVFNPSRVFTLSCVSYCDLSPRTGLGMGHPEISVSRDTLCEHWHVFWLRAWLWQSYAISVTQARQWRGPLAVHGIVSWLLCGFFCGIPWRMKMFPVPVFIQSRSGWSPRLCAL